MHLRTLALVGLLCAAFVCVHASEPKPIRGIKSRDYHRYSQPQFICFDQSATISSSQVNDDYCDCADGSDEPGTSACVNSRFWCANRGAKGQSLPSSRVNDGVCDCCDGTDELFSFSGVNCPNTCEDAGRAAKEALINEIAATEAGVTARAALLATAQQAISAKREKYAKYEKLMSERKVLLDAAKTKKETEEAVENEERTRRDAEKAAKDAAAAAAAEAAAAAAAAPAATDAAAPAATDATGEAPIDPASFIPKIPIPDPYAEHHKLWEEHLEFMGQQEAKAAFPATARGAKRPEKKEEKKAEAVKEEEKKENFPYPPEYAYQAADDQDKAKTEEKKENFPYPAEYAAPPAGGAATPAEEAHDEEEEYVEPEYEGDDGEDDGEEDDGEDDDDADNKQAAEVDAPYVHPVQSNKQRRKSKRAKPQKTKQPTPVKKTVPPPLKPQAPVQDQTVPKASLNDLIAGAKADGPSLFEAIEQRSSGRFFTMKYWTSLMEDTVSTTVAMTYSISLNAYYVLTGDFVWKDVSARWSRNTLDFFENFGNAVLYTVVSIERSVLGTETILESLLDPDEIKKLKDEMWRKNVPKTFQPAPTVPKDLYIHPAAEVARTEFSKIDKKVNRLQGKMDELKKSLDRDYGTDGQFAHMDGQCFELQVKQYTYEVCPYKSAAQKEGHSSTSLGSWSGIETAADGTILMKFTGGQTCWQGPARSLTVKLKCGAADALSNVEEPSKCVYEIQMQTPAVCNAQHAQVLRMNLEGGLIEEDEE